MKDPLAGKRKAIARKETAVLIWPAVGEEGVLLPAPVSKGERFAVHGVPMIQIESCNRKLPAGKPAEWHATFVRLEVDRPQLLRRVPSGLPSSSDMADGRTDIERARVESAYTSSARMAIVDEPESVGPDWKDGKAAERDLGRRKDAAEIRALDFARKENRRFKSEVAETMKQMIGSGRDLTPLLNDIYERLARERRDMDEAA